MIDVGDGEPTEARVYNPYDRPFTEVTWVKADVKMVKETCHAGGQMRRALWLYGSKMSDEAKAEHEKAFFEHGSTMFWGFQADAAMWVCVTLIKA